MRLNEPITAHEREVSAGEPLVSRTDVGGRITFANHVFVEISGFTDQELEGAPHNIVRHPHMPQQAFANLWATIKAGRPWDGLVKNRAKNGDFYWVRANVTPVIENGSVTGYISIRSKPTRAEVVAAERAYAAIRDGSAKGIGLRDGELVRTGWRARLALACRSVRGRLTSTMLAVLLLIAAIATLGFSGMAASNAVLRQVYENDLVSVDQLRGVVDRMRDIRNLIAQIAIALARGERPDTVLADREPVIRRNLAQIDQFWRDYKGKQRSPEQLAQIGHFDQQYANLLHDGIEPALVLARSGDPAKLDQLFQTQMPPMFQVAFDTDRDLVTLQIRIGQAAYVASEANLRWRLAAGVAIAAAGMLGACSLGWGLFRGIRRPVRDLEAHLHTIMHGNYDAEIVNPSVIEFCGTIAMLRALRANLAFAEWERREFERRSDSIRRETVEQMAATIEAETGGAVERVGARAKTMLSEADAMLQSTQLVNDIAEQSAHAGDQALKNTQTVSAASEELATSIREVSARVGQASEVARAAAVKGAAAGETIRSLARAGDRIGGVVRLIANIAARTNLLALNATIEAARAGEAGKGFAVVAGEVKALAAQTARATNDIASQIAELHGATENAVVEVVAIGHTLDEISEVSMSVAAAIEQQTAATQEIARNVVESSEAVGHINELMGQVAREAAATGHQADLLRGNASSVAEDVVALRSALVRTVRTATVEANRRSEERVPTNVRCHVSFGAAQPQLSAQLFDLSLHGAAIDLQGDGAAVQDGGRGVLVLTDDGNVRTEFEVRARDPSGRLHVRFTQVPPQPAFEAAVRRLVGASGVKKVAA